MSSALAEALGFGFRKPELLKSALTHRSFAAESQGAGSNERLEFLGDSVLSAVVADYLYRTHPEEDEGSLSKRKAHLVSKGPLARWAADLGLGSHLYLGAGEETSGGRARPSLLSNALEAVIGAMYLDGGYEAAAAFIRRRLETQPGEAESGDYKSRLQERMQKRFKVPPHYEVTRTSGPDHEKVFNVNVRMGKKLLGSGAGRSKKEAEQSAARHALEQLGSTEQ